MDNSNFDVQIEDVEKQINILRDRMEDVCKELLEETKEFVVTWSQSYVDRAITTHPDITKEYGVEGLRNLKADLQKWIAMIPSTVEKHLNNDKYWSHRGQLPDDPYRSGSRYYVHGNSVPDELSDGVRELLGYVGDILIKHGFANTKQYGEWEVKTGYKQPKYRYGYTWSEKMIAVIKRYSDMYNELIKLNRELNTVKREKAEAEAKNLWDEA